MSSRIKKCIRFVDEAPEKSVIEIYGTIGGVDRETWEDINTIQIIQGELKRLSELNTKEIEVRICSYGGFVDHALAIYDALRDHPAKITTVVNSFCASSATIIAMSGEVRKISKNALFLIHHCSSYAAGNAHDLEMELESQRTTNNVIYNIYKERCAKSEQELADLFNYDNGNGKWITAQEAFDFGFATEIYNEEAVPKVAFAERSMINTLRLPELPEEHNHVEDRTFTIADIVSAIRTEIQNIFSRNETQKNMKFKEKFVALSTLFAAMAEEEYNAESGARLTDEQLAALESNIKEADGLRERVAQLEALNAETKEKCAALTSELETVSAERDDYKGKYENAPAVVSAVTGNDPAEDEFANYVENSPKYKELEKFL